MNKTTKILFVMAILLFALSPLVSAYKQSQIQEDPLFQIGNADRTYDYQGNHITCYLGRLFPGQPIYWCGWLNPDGSFIMDHSWLVNQSKAMGDYYTAGSTSTFTFSGKIK